jgi:hypothetical protein
MSIFNHFQDLNLTTDQQQALERVEQFLSSDQEVFLLKGYAGTGKTTLLKGICQYLESNHAAFRLMAPTGRAAMILSRKTGVEASTIHRGIFNMDELKEKEDGSSFKFSYQLKVNEDSASCVYLVDEASMISDVYSEDEFFMFGSGRLLEDLSKFAFPGEMNRKIIFIGDTAQLPPVNMSFSPALDSAYLGECYQLGVQEATLTQVVRQQEGSGILNTATSLRESLRYKAFNQFSIQYQRENVSRVAPEDFMERYTPIAKRGGLEQVIVITHSNRQALDYNFQIREFRYKDNDPRVRKQDRLLITKNNYNGEVELFNGMFAKVLEVGGISYTAKPRFTIKGGETIERELDFRDVLVEVVDAKGNPRRLRTTLLDRFLTVEEGRLDPYDQRALYVDFKERMREKGIKPGTDDFREALKTDLYFNALQAKYGYAITCHKSQGGEWKNVIIDFKVYMGKLTPGFFRWAYTAITRAKDHLYCVDAPNYNALSKFVVKGVERISTVMKGTYFVPTSEGQGDYFVAYRKERILALCEARGIDVQFKTHANQLDTTFKQADGTVRVQLWFGKAGFSRTSWVSSTSEAFKNQVNDLLHKSLMPKEVPFEYKFPFQKELHEYLLGLLKDGGILLTNVVQKDWSDQYFLYTGAECALLEFFYNSKHQYTKAMPKSMLGANDEKLNRLIKRLRDG